MKPQFKHEILSTPAAIISGVLLFLVPLFLYGGLYQVLAPLELHRWMEEHLFSNFFRNFITEDVLIRENGRIIAQVGPPVENALLYKVTYAWLFVFFGGYGVGLAIWFWKGFRELMAHSQEMRWAFLGWSLIFLGGGLLLTFSYHLPMGRSDRLFIFGGLFSFWIQGMLFWGAWYFISGAFIGLSAWWLQKLFLGNRVRENERSE